MKHSAIFLLLMLPLALASGCMPPTSAPEKSPAATAAGGAGDQAQPPAASPQAPAATPATPALAGGLAPNDLLIPQPPQRDVLPPTLNPPTNAPANPSSAPPDAVRAGVGVGAQGRSLDNESGVLVTPAKAFFSVRERVIFEASIPKAISLFEATEGRKPTSHEEFMSRVVQANNIQLPRLPDDRQYFYDPQQGELMVVRQRR